MLSEPGMMMRYRPFYMTALLGGMLIAAAPAQAESYPAIPEPMIFDMMRPLGARQGELEINTLAQVPLSGDATVEWAPEIEYALADGFAIEFELPFEDMRLTELKLGLQATFGTLNDGRSAHGVQYLGIYDRHTHRYSNTVAYMFGHRFNDRWSSMSMIGLGEIAPGRGRGHNALIVNQSVFADAGPGSTLGLEFNYKGGEEGGILLMPQLHQDIGYGLNLQGGIGIQKERHEVARPRLALRLIREL